MADLPQIEKNNSPLYRWSSAVNSNISKHKPAVSRDLEITQTVNGTMVNLKRRYKYGYGLPYQHEFDGTKGYSPDDFTRVLHDTNYSDLQGNLVPATPGVWICVVPVPSETVSDALKTLGHTGTQYKPYLRQDGVNYAPQWPEPAQTASTTNPNGRYWELLSMLPKLLQICGAPTYVDMFISGSLTGSFSP